MPDASEASPSDSPATEPPKWLSHGYDRLLYPLFTVLIVVLTLLLYLYIRRLLHKPATSTNWRAHDTTPSSSAANSPMASAANARLSQEAISSLPAFEYAAAYADHKLECAVCLSEFRIGDKGRLLPRCGHRFHANCVDLWFQSHSTCPICRSSAVVTAAAAAESKSLGMEETV